MKREEKERKIPCISFIIPLNLRFSVALDWETSEVFKNIVRNKGDSISHVMLEFVFKRLNIADRDIREFERFMVNNVDDVKKRLYTELALASNPNLTHANQKLFCKLMLEDIKKYIKKNEN